MQSPLLVIIIMVKNEATVIEKTLLPFVHADLNKFCVLDTGSTDATVEVTKNFFTKYNLHGFLDEEPFIDFSTSRNRALELAETHFPNATFFLMIDADWYTHNVQKLIEFCEKHKEDTEALYNIRLRMNAHEICTPRLFRTNVGVRYFGVVHEIPEISGHIIVYNDVYFIVSTEAAHRRKTRNRFNSDLQLLLTDFEKNPLNTRTIFYLGQTYECLQDIKNAYKYYLKRSAFTNHDNPEEDSVTFFRLGYLAEHLCLVDDNFSWEIAMEHYMKAFTKRKGRIEPLLAIAAYYLPKFPQISFIYLKYTCSVSYPKNDKIFVQREMYEFTRYELLSSCAWAMNEFVLGKNACEMALQAQPSHKGLRQRLRMYESELNFDIHLANETEPQIKIPTNIL